jgi:2-polyprenyl-6-methoxyphenol hydroxylase-like FAD-dependent oxidoreductase
MMLGFLLARRGVDAVVLEKHGDFLRDFRGDSMHPSTLEVMHELGLLEQLLELPHHRIDRVQAWIDDEIATFADFTHLPTRCQFGTMLPQWDFLSFLADQAKAFPAFSVRMDTEVQRLIVENERVRGVVARGPDGEVEVRADLVVGCDGRDSVVRDQAGLPVREHGAPMDVLWFRLPRQADDPEDVHLRLQAGRFIVLIGRPDHWQCGFVIAKNSYEQVREQGLDALRREIAESVPFFADRVDEIATWEMVPHLSVRVDSLRRWYRPGLLCIGDAAHAMSPAGGVGINLAIQDAVAAANILGPTLERGAPTVADLRKVQRRRSWPARLTQRVQVLIGDRALRPALAGDSHPALRGVSILRRFPFLTRLTGRAIGTGARPEHVAASYGASR